MTMSTAESPTAAASPARGGDGCGAPAAPNSAVAALEQQLSRLFATAKALTRDRAVSVHPELSPGGYMALATLVRSGPQHAGSLAAALFVDKSVISRIIRQLIDLGLAERRADPDDGRAFYIAATPEAVREIDAIRDDYRRSLHSFLAGWDPVDIAQLTDLLGKLNDAGAAAAR
jgi:DNA-binding MarR family transcriptional regulator